MSTTTTKPKPSPAPPAPAVKEAPSPEAIALAEKTAGVFAGSAGHGVTVEVLCGLHAQNLQQECERAEQAHAIAQSELRRAQEEARKLEVAAKDKRGKLDAWRAEVRRKLGATV